jgi:hypothetical protein
MIKCIFFSNEMDSELLKKLSEPTSEVVLESALALRHVLSCKIINKKR